MDAKIETKLKNPAKIEPERSKAGLRSKFNSKNVKSALVNIFTYLILSELAFIIIYPLLLKFSGSIMSETDMFDRTVNLVPRDPTLANYLLVLVEASFVEAGMNTFLTSLMAASLQTFICAMTGYAIAKIKGKLGMLVMGIVIFSILVPPQIILVPLYLKFRFFDIAGIITLFTGDTISFIDKLWPLVILSLTGFGFKNGVYIFVMRQFFKGVPEEIEEAAYIDGSSTFGAYLKVILPISVPMLITIFMLAFSWQWTDSFYSGIFFSKFKVLANTIFVMNSATSFQYGFYANILLHTGVLLAIAPLIVIYSLAQKWIVTGIERSGIVG